VKRNKSPFGFEQAQDSPGFTLWQTTTLWQRQIKKALDPHDISHAQFVIMATLLWFENHDHETTQAAIIDWTKLDKMTVSKSLKKLALQKLVKRSEHAMDTRAKNVALTKKGITLASTLVPLVEAVDDNFFGKASISDQKTLIALLNNLIRDEE